MFNISAGYKKIYEQKLIYYMYTSLFVTKQWYKNNKDIFEKRKGVWKFWSDAVRTCETQRLYNGNEMDATI